MKRPITPLDELVRDMQPVLNPGVWVFCTVAPGVDVDGLDAIARFRESEGLSVIVGEQQALDAGLPILFRAAWITLAVHSDLQAVGLTAVVASRLAELGISCNVVAASFHDHLFVPVDAADAAVAALLDMQQSGRVTGLPALQVATAAEREPLREVLDRMGDGFVVLDTDDCFVFANRTAVQMLGRRSEAELLGRNLWQELPLTRGTPFERVYRQAVQTQQMATDEDHFSADKIWYEGRLYPSPNGMSIYFRDVTQRKRAEEALRRSELRFRLAAVHGQVWDWDIVSGRVEFPLAFWHQLGLASPPVDQVVATLRERMHPDDRPRWQSALREHIARSAPYEIEFRLRSHDGQWRWFRSQGLATRDDSGRAIYMAGTTFDITAQTLAVQALREAERYRRNVFEQLADAVLLVDQQSQGRILDANPQALRMLGYEREELLSLCAHQLLAEHEQDRLADVLRGVHAGETAFAAWDHRRKDGSVFPAEVSLRAMDATRDVAVIRDVSLRRESERVLLAIELELSALAQQLLSQERVTTRRIAQGLHDHLGQTLAVARLNLDACIATHGDSMPQPLKNAAERISALLDQAVREARQVLADLRPPLLEEQGLAVALSDEIELRATPAGKADVLLELADEVEQQRWPDDVEYCALMVAREAIANAQLHSGASLVRVLLDGREGSLCLDIIDDGKGVPAPMSRGLPGHLGIVGMRERAIAIGARFAVDAAAGGGTHVKLRWEAPAA